MARTPKVVEDRREQIIDAAMNVFAQKGFTKATNKDIAHEAGITPGLIYHYFESKESLLMAVVEQRSPLKFITNIPAEFFSLPPEQFFRVTIVQILGFIESEQFVRFLRVVLSEMLYENNALLAPIPPFIFARVDEFISSYLEQKAATGDVRNVDGHRLAQVLISCMGGFVLRRQVIRDPAVSEYTHEQIADIIVDICFRGVLSH